MGLWGYIVQQACQFASILYHQKYRMQLQRGEVRGPSNKL